MGNWRVRIEGRGKRVGIGLAVGGAGRKQTRKHVGNRKVSRMRPPRERDWSEQGQVESEERGGELRTHMGAYIRFSINDPGWIRSRLRRGEGRVLQAPKSMAKGSGE